MKPLIITITLAVIGLVLPWLILWIPFGVYQALTETTWSEMIAGLYCSCSAAVGMFSAGIPFILFYEIKKMTRETLKNVEGKI